MGSPNELNLMVKFKQGLTKKSECIIYMTGGTNFERDEVMELFGVVVK